MHEEMLYELQELAVTLQREVKKYDNSFWYRLFYGRRLKKRITRFEQRIAQLMVELREDLEEQAGPDSSCSRSSRIRAVGVLAKLDRLEKEYTEFRNSSQ